MGTDQDRLLEVPSPHDAGKAVVTQALSQLGQAVGRERCNEEEVCPLAQLNVQHRVPLDPPGMPLLFITCTLRLTSCYMATIALAESQAVNNEQWSIIQHYVHTWFNALSRHVTASSKATSQELLKSRPQLCCLMYSTASCVPCQVCHPFQDLLCNGMLTVAYTAAEAPCRGRGTSTRVGICTVDCALTHLPNK